MIKPKTITGIAFQFDDSLNQRLRDFDADIRFMWDRGELNPEKLKRIYQQSKIDELYHSNRIEGNSLSYGETQAVIEEGAEIPAKPRKDQLEAKNLSGALDYAQEIAINSERAVIQGDVRGIHKTLLDGIQSDAGSYRDSENKIKGSRHSTPEAFLVEQHMTELSDYLKEITDLDTPQPDLPIFAAAAAHAWLVQIHPFSDGNGRTARALMNLILMRRGYPPCIITEDDRSRYINALEDTWEGDLTPFIELVQENVNEQRKSQKWLTALTARLEQPASKQAQEQYDTWHDAMQYLKRHFQYVADNINAEKTLGNLQLKFRDYGALGLEKYMSLSDGGRAKKTWFFGIEFISGEQRARYVFYVGAADERLKRRSSVALIIAKNSAAGYERLQKIEEPNTVDLFQIGFDIRNNRFVALTKSAVRERIPETLTRQFFEQVIERDFGD